MMAMPRPPVICKVVAQFRRRFVPESHSPSSAPGPEAEICRSELHDGKQTPTQVELASRIARPFDVTIRLEE
jgi:hypothetical protein